MLCPPTQYSGLDTVCTRLLSWVTLGIEKTRRLCMLPDAWHYFGDIKAGNITVKPLTGDVSNGLHSNS